MPSKRSAKKNHSSDKKSGATTGSEDEIVKAQKTPSNSSAPESSQSDRMLMEPSNDDETFTHGNEPLSDIHRTPASSSTGSSSSEVDLTNMPFKKQDDTARVQDLERQLCSVKTANVNLQRTIADQEQWLTQREDQLRAAKGEVAVLQSRLEASKAQPLAGCSVPDAASPELMVSVSDA